MLFKEGQKTPPCMMCENVERLEFFDGQNVEVEYFCSCKGLEPDVVTDAVTEFGNCNSFRLHPKYNKVLDGVTL